MSSSTSASAASPSQPQMQSAVTDHHHHISPRTSASRPLSSSSTASSDYSNFSLPSSPRTTSNTVDAQPTPSPSTKSTTTRIENSYCNKSTTSKSTPPTVTAIPSASELAIATTGFTISDDDITFDGQPLSALYEMTRYRYVHVQCGDEGLQSQRSRVEERGRRRVR